MDERAMECTGCGKDFDGVPVNVGPFRCPRCEQMVRDKAPPAAKYQVPSSWSDIPFSGGERFLIGTVCLVLNAMLLGAVYVVGMAFAPAGESHRTYVAMAVSGVTCLMVTVDVAITLATGWTGRGEDAGGGFHRVSGWARYGRPAVFYLLVAGIALGLAGLVAAHGFPDID